ncbi:G-protein coupled receptor dmsr-1-like [Mercenaria mercenaria]|uniref:G-protein coupled receptor dmsr-1-like n=1 Tax=Mercenaria mercenaria TaxID=6596 RepID=UPI00234FA3B2|nr:G-protein coupled receptor dmsr-1-like [Mercenaria mercenaria]
MNDTVLLSPYKSEVLESFSMWYGKVHGYISIVICAMGIILNIINIVVLTRKTMQTPINSILTWLAVFDIATMISYVPFAYHFYCQYSTLYISSDKNSKPWMIFLLVYLNFSATTHTISIWLAVTLAIFRHRHLNSPAKGSLTRMRRLIRARVAVCVIVCISVLIMIPNYLIHRLEKLNLSDNSSLYVFEDWNLGSRQTNHFITLALIMYSVLAKLLPSLLIIIYGGLLLQTLRKSMKVKRRLFEGRASLSYQRNRGPARTTVMLLTVIVLFLVTELPQGVLIVCSIFLDKFFEHIYIPLGDIMDILALINNAINFVLYCTMSHQFRRTFIKLFCSFSLLDILSSTNSQSPSKDNVSNNISLSDKSFGQERNSCITLYTKTHVTREESIL